MGGTQLFPFFLLLSFLLPFLVLRIGEKKRIKKTPGKEFLISLSPLSIGRVEKEEAIAP